MNDVETSSTSVVSDSFRVVFGPDRVSVLLGCAFAV